jgi:C1A family cysteine protease
LREYFPQAFDQGQRPASPAHAVIGLVEYFERRALGRTTALSRLFLHQVTQKLLGEDANASADLRTTLKSLLRFGAPPERYWPYESTGEPGPHLYAFADRYRPSHYIRLDGPAAAGSESLEVIKAFLSAGFPAVFGFPVPSSFSDTGDIPYRPTFDSVCGGQAVVAVGFDDSHLRSTRGALLFRSSWGDDWGEDGYGWLPYAYVQRRLAVDFWTLLRADWLESGEFAAPLSLRAARGRKSAR